MADQSTFDRFYVGAHRRLLRYAYALTGDVGDAQDLVQEAFVRAWQRWDQIRRYEDIEAWLRTVIWRLSAKRRRSLGVAARHLVRLGPPEVALEPSPDSVAIIAALRSLPEAQRRVVVLHHLVGLSVDEVAVEVGAPVNTIKSRLVRGRAALAPLLSDEPITSEVSDA